MTAGEGRRLALGTVLLAGLGLFVALRLEVTNDITHFLPGGIQRRELSVARELASGELSRTLILLVSGAPGTPAAELAAAGAAFERALRDQPAVAAELAFLEGGPPAEVEQALWSLVQPRRYGFLDLPEGALDADGLADTVADLRRQLATPLSTLVGRVAPEDPWLVLPDLVTGLAAGGEQLVVVDGRFLTGDESATVLFLGTRSASFDAAAMGPLLDGVQAAFARVDGDHDGALQLSLAGSARFALRAETAIKADIQRVGLGSLAGLALLLALLFRSPRLVLLTLPVLGAGFLAGLTACLLVFGRVHGLTLAFGAALIGVSIDYTIHYHCHHLLAPSPDGPRATLRAIAKGLSLGAATTVVGFVALLVATFPGLRELALFAATGIGAALAATHLFLPGLAEARPRLTGLTRRVTAGLDGLLAVLGRRPLLAALPALAALVLAILGLPRVTWNDDVADLNSLDPVLLAEDQAVRDAVMPYEQGRLVVALGDDLQAALEVNDRLAGVLDQARAAGELDGFRSAARLLPSAALQRRRDARLRDDADLWPRLATALEQGGFVVEAFEPLGEHLAGPAPAPLTWDDLTDTPLASLVRPFRVDLPDGVAVLSFVHGLHDAPALAARVGALDGALLVDVSAAFSAAYGAYRSRMTQLLLLGLVAVLALVFLRHRAWRPTAAACLPALLGAAATVSVLALAGLPLNMLSLVSLLMVVSMGVDYGVFLVEAGDHGPALTASHLAVAVAALSTLLGFGLLALSDHPALVSIGAPAGLGVLCCVVLAPTVRLLTRPGRPS